MAPPESSVRDKSLAAGIILGWAVFLLVCGTLPGARLWGLNHLAFLPGAARWSLIAAALLSTALVWFARPRWLSFISPNAFAGVGVLIWLGSCYLARAATSLLGDGYLRADEAARRVPEFFVITDLLPAWITSTIKQRSPLSGVLTGAESVALLSILSGVIFVIGLWLLWPRAMGAGDDKVEGRTEPTVSRAPIIWMLCAGSAQLYFGYIELYAISAAFLTLFTLSILAYERGRVSAVWPVVFWVGAFWSHIFAIAWAPLLVWVAVTARGRAESVRGAVLAVAAVLVSVTLLAFLWQPGQSSPWRHLLPVWGNGYAILDWRHAADIVNIVLLMIPAGLALLLYDRKSPRIWRGSTIALLTAPSAAFLLLLSVDLGFARDWDLFALIGTPSITLVAVTLAREGRFWSWRQTTAASFVAVSAFALWVWVNADEAASRERFAALLNLDRHTGVSGREALARYWREAGRWDLAVEELGKALQVEPTARLAVQRGIGWTVMRNHDSALVSFEQAVRLDPEFADGQFGVGQSLWVLGRPAESVRHLERAVALDSSRADYRYHLGMSLRDVQRNREAVGQLQLAARMAPGQPAYSHALAVTLAESGKPDSAIGTLTALLARIPEYSPAYIDLAGLLLSAGRVDDARRAVVSYGGLVPMEKWDPAMRRIADSLNTPVTP